MGAEKPVVIFGKSGCCICLTVKALIYVKENRHCLAIVLTSQASFFSGENFQNLIPYLLLKTRLSGHLPRRPAG
ncbi:hypothetical protein ACSBR2_021230 [Camellia fascicularis]